MTATPMLLLTITTNARHLDGIKTLLRDQYLIDARPVNKTSGHPFKIAEIEEAIEDALR